MKRAVILLGILIAGFNSYAQKVKYKDLYVLLRARNYEDASPFLYTFLTQEPEHPNANYQMGLMLEHKLSELDILKETEKIQQQADSAILYFNKAHDLIDDKDIRKHDDDYYELFKRRNLRTGKFEVILSDVQLDIEDRVEKLKAIKKGLKGVKSRFDNSIVFYNSAKNKYDSLRSEFNDLLTLELGANDQTVMLLQSLASESDSAVTNIKKYIDLRKSFEGEHYKEIVLELKPIEEFSEEPVKEPDFYSNKLSLYNFITWSLNQQSQIKARKEYIDNLISFDESLESMCSNIQTDSVDLSKEVFGMVTSPVLKELKLEDFDSWLMNLFQYKIGRLNLGSAWIGWYLDAEDSIDLGYQLDYVSKIRNQLDGVEKLEKQMRETDKGPFFKRYNRFVSVRYKNESGLNEYVNSQADFILEQEKRIDILEQKLKKKDQWGWINQDSISLVISKDTTGYSTLYSDSLENRNYFLAGVDHKMNSPQLFFVSVPSSRNIDSLYLVPNDSTFSFSNIDSLQFTQTSQKDGKYYFLFWESTMLEQPTDSVADNNTSFHSVLIGVDRATGVLWKTKVTGLSTIPQVELNGQEIQIIQDGLSPLVFNLEGKQDESGTEE